MKDANKNNIRLGLFIVLASALLISGIYFVGTRKNLFGSSFLVSTVFKNAGGLQPGNNVRYSGINVGTVSDISIISDSSIRLDLKLVDRVRPYIRKNAVASLSVDGIVGSAIVNISPGQGEAPSIEPGDILQAENLRGTTDLIATLGNTNDNISLFVRDLLEISGKVKNGPGTMNDLLQDTSISNGLSATIKNLEETSRLTLLMMKQLNYTVAQIEHRQGLVHQLIYDTVVMNNLKELSTGLNETLVYKLDTIIDKLHITGDNLANASLRINQLVEDVQTGPGVMNDLIYDEATALSLQRTLKNVEEGTASFKEDMRALQDNFLFRRYFRKQRRQSDRDTLSSDP